EALHGRRLRADLGFVPWLRDPDVLCRADTDRLVLPENTPVPVPGTAGIVGGPDTVTAGSAGLAGVLLRVRGLRPVEPVPAVVRHGQPSAGLRADGPGQGCQRTAGALGACVPQLADHDRHAARAVDPDAGRRRHLRRGRVQLPGHGPGVLPGRAERGLRDADGVHGARDRGDGRRKPVGRCWLCDARPEGEVQLMSMVTPPPELPSVGVVPEVPPAGAGAFTPEARGVTPGGAPRSPV